MNKHLEWPTPPGYALPVDGEHRAAETCLATYNDGRMQIGSLLRFMPRDGLIEIQARGADDPVRVALSELKGLHLTQLLAPTDAAAPACDRKQGKRESFEVEFLDGEKISGETLGFVDGRYGLFLLVMNRTDTLTRFFAPNLSIRTFRVGDQTRRPATETVQVSACDAAAEPAARSEAHPQRMTDYVEAADILTPDDLQGALASLKSAPWLKLGDAVIQEGIITPQQLQEALQRQQGGRGLPLGDILVEMGFVDRRTVNKTLARQFGIPYVDLRKFQSFDPAAVELLPGEICRRHAALPLCLLGEATLVVAMENPIGRDSLQELAFFSRHKIQPVMASEEDILRELDAAYGAVAATRETSGAELVGQLAASEQTPEVVESQVDESDSTLVRLVNRMILEAIEQGASDIHIETYPEQLSTQVRIRKDGTLVNHLEIPAAYRSALVSRIKIMCQLDIAERRKPQDGKIKFRKFGPADVELRVATIPTANGLEDVVMRVLSAGKPIPLHKLDLSPANLAKLTQVVARPHGLCLVCGPTGSGKTTTLHSVLSHVNVPGRKIWTAEDPIEITQAGLRQVQVNPRIGWTFAAAMRTFLRADPDIIMLGEIRDADTAKVAIEGSLTGHFVYSTLHTNSAPESIVRLLDLGADPFNFADALLGVLAQRLAKRLCLQCRQPRTASAAEIAELAAEYCADGTLEAADVLRDWQARFLNSQGRFTLHAAIGCTACNQTGYRGRIGLHELFIVSPATKRLVQTRATVAELLVAATTEGMRTLKQDGIEKILLGLTDIHQVRSVCG